NSVSGTVGVGVPFNSINLYPVPASIQADAISVSFITSDIVMDLAGNVLTNEKFTVFAADGTITNSDIDAVSGGKQVATDTSGVLNFGVRSSGTPKSAVIITADSLRGNLYAATNIDFLSGLRILTITSDLINSGFVNKGQTNILLTVVITNSSGNPFNFDNSNSKLNFKNSGSSIDLFFTVNTNDSITVIPPNASLSKTYLVDIDNSINVNTVDISYNLVGNIGVDIFNIDSSTQDVPVSHSWTVKNGLQLTMGWTVQENVVIGNIFNAVLTVSNTGDVTASNVSWNSFNISAGSIFTTNSSPSPASQDIPAGESRQFIWQFVSLTGTSGLSALFSVRAVGYDVNSGDVMYTPLESRQVVVINSLSTHLLMDASLNEETTTVEGAEKLIFTLNLSNDANPSLPDYQLRSIEFNLEDNLGTPLIPSQVLSALRVKYNETTIAQNLAPLSTGSTITIDLSSNPILIPSGALTNLQIYGVIANPSSVQAFKLSILDASKVNVTVGSNILNPVSIVDIVGRPLALLKSGVIVIKSRNFKSSLSSYPNPFSPSRGNAKIDFYLAEPARVTIKLYTVTGGHVLTLVENKDYNSGLNTELWSGINGRGRGVRNGVYFCIIKNETTGEEGVVKVAVMK
ncbi:MAG: hypothetical protein KAR07_07755, partial [Spirochaetes bacterium]|nr:hypothetical protein [Spirochaetota bacterium]